MTNRCIRPIGYWIGFLLLAASLTGAQPEPLLMVAEYGAWFGSSGPRFVLYDDGSIIYQAPRELTIREHRSWDWLSQSRYWRTSVPNAEAFLKKMLPSGARQWKDDYQVSEATDQDSSTIWCKGRCIEIYGEWREIQPARDATPEEESWIREKNQRRKYLPKDLQAFMQSIDDFKAGISPERWLPDHIRVELATYERADGALFPWPIDFPAPVRVYKGSSGFEQLKADVPVDKFDSLVALAIASQSRAAVVFAGQKLTIDNVSYPFPRADRWEKDLKQKRDEKEARILKNLTPEQRRQLLGL
jgi:hypothetical protein